MDFYAVGGGAKLGPCGLPGGAAALCGLLRRPCCRWLPSGSITPRPPRPPRSPPPRIPREPAAAAAAAPPRPPPVPALRKRFLLDGLRYCRVFAAICSMKNDEPTPSERSTTGLPAFALDGPCRRTGEPLALPTVVLVRPPLPPPSSAYTVLYRRCVPRPPTLHHCRASACCRSLCFSLCCSSACRRRAHCS